MTLKTKLITSVSMFFLVVALLVVGVWAVSTVQVTMGGTISFNATNIYATITGTIEGATNAKAMTTLEYSAKTEPDATAKATWCQDLTFAEATIPTIKWTITIENKSERALYVSLTDNITSLSNATKTLTFAGTTYTSGEKEVPAKTSKVFTMEIKVSDTNTSATVDYDFDFNMRDESYNIAKVEDFPELSFSFNESAQEATIDQGSGSTIADLVIPELLSKQGKVYTVTKIGASAFNGKTNLETVIIPDSVTTIQSQAFANCSSLTSVTVGKGIQMLSVIFENCPNLAVLNVMATTPPGSASGMFGPPFGINSALKIYVPTASVDVYKSEWAEFANYIEGKDF